jgi:RNA polymerase sigma-70 factor (ECF subfamily)
MHAAILAIHAVSRTNHTAFEEKGEADAIILERCRAGEREAFGILLHRYRDRILNLAYQLLGQRDDAEDVAQEAFTQAFRNIASYRGEAQFYTWLYRITVNLCLGRKRRTRKNETFDEEQDAAHRSGPAQVETRLAVEQALRELSEPLRVALVLREMQGLSYEEIAEILYVPIGTVRSRLSEARRKFREVWEREEP